MTVDGGDFALFTSYMDHGSVATKIRTRFIASFFHGGGQNSINYFFFLQDNQCIFLQQRITTLNMKETTVNFVQDLKMSV